MTILDRLRAQPELMEVLGAQAVPEKPVWACAYCDCFDRPPSNHCVFDFCEKVDTGERIAAVVLCGGSAIDLANDDCAGSALLLVRCMAYLEGKCGFADLGPQSDEHDGVLLSGYCARGFDKRGVIAAEGAGETKVEAALLAVLEVAEGK